MVKNLSQLKRTMKKHPRFEITDHCRKACIGEIRQVNHVDSRGFYSAIEGIPDTELRTINGGKGIVHWWRNASNWDFEDGICSFYLKGSHTEDNLVIAFRIIDEEAA